MYQLNKKYAQESIFGEPFLTEKGSFEGKFIQAIHVVSQNGTKGIDFVFLSNDGRKARFVLYIQKSTGEEIYGYKQLCKLMWVLGTQGVTSAQIMGRLYNHDSKTMIKKLYPQAPELLNKEIGLILNVENYKKSDGTDDKKSVFVECFEVRTGLTSAELSKGITEPQERIYILEHLKERVRKESNANNGFSNTGQSPKASNVDDMDDDIPW